MCVLLRAHNLFEFALAAVASPRERVCCLLVLNLVSSTLREIRPLSSNHLLATHLERPVQAALQDTRVTTSHHHETRCMVSTLRPGSCPQPPSRVRSSPLDSLACAAAGCHTILVRKGILLVLLLITINFRSVTDLRLSRAIQSMTISIFNNYYRT